MPNPLKLYFAATGRIGRGAYWLSILALISACILAAPFAMLMPPLAGLVLAYVLSNLAAKRLRDAGIKGRWAALPFVVVAVYVALLVFYSFLTIGCCGSGSGGSPQARQVYRWLTDAGNYVMLSLPLTWLLAGVLPGRSTPQDPISGYAG